MTAEPTRVAAFDFDGTLTDRDSVVPFVRTLIGPRSAFSALSWRAVRSLVATARALSRRDRDRFRAVATRVVFTGMPYRVVTDAAERYASTSLVDHLRADTTALLNDHVNRGDLVLIVSASYREYLEPIAARLGVSAILATELEVVDGICTGELVDGNCRGPEKVNRIERWLAAQGLPRERVTVTAYGDSSGDRELLAWADRAVWVEQRPPIDDARTDNTPSAAGAEQPGVAGDDPRSAGSPGNSIQ